MGHWAKALFGHEFCGDIAIIIAGTNPKEVETKILSAFGETLSSKDSVYHGHLVSHNGHTHPIATNVYGAPAMIDVLSEMHDGGCRTAIFVGYAYGGFRNLPVGSIVVPEKSFHFEGIYRHMDPRRKHATPDSALLERVKDMLARHKISFSSGANISVPSVYFQPVHANPQYNRIRPLTVEMELSACLSRATDIGIRAAGILIVSDNRSEGIHHDEKKKRRAEMKYEVIQVLAKEVDGLGLPPLPNAEQFHIDDQLAEIIADPKDITNVYRKKK